MLLETMFIKRFCLPANTNVEKYETGEENINSCVCGHYNHIACVLKGKERQPEKSECSKFWNKYDG